MRVGVGRIGWAVPLSVLALSGCGALGSAEDDAAAATVLFYRSAQIKPEVACGSLAPGTLRELESTTGPCATSLPRLQLPAADRVTQVEVYGNDAIVRLDRDVAFLARFDTTWKITAAGCRPVPDRPYECELKGP